MPGHHPIADPLFIEGGELSTLRHKTGGTIHAPDFDALPAHNDACVRIEIEIAAASKIASQVVCGNSTKPKIKANTYKGYQ